MTKMIKSYVAGWTSDSPTPAQLKEFFSQIETGRITKSGLQAFLRGEVDKANVFVLLTDWQKFYQDVFGVKVDLSAVPVPARQEGFDRLIVVAPGMTPQRPYDKCAELFPCWKWTSENLDEIVHSDRVAKEGAYAVWFRDRVEADEELKNLSADQLKTESIPGITLEERLLMELKYFKETGKHLDIRCVTLCAGSRFSGGYVPHVHWEDGELRVYWCDPDHVGGALRSRVAIS